MTEDIGNISLAEFSSAVTERDALKSELSNAVKLIDALLGLELGSSEAALAFVERHTKPTQHEIDRDEALESIGWFG